jgi:hypothetical protein
MSEAEEPAAEEGPAPGSEDGAADVAAEAGAAQEEAAAPDAGQPEREEGDNPESAQERATSADEKREWGELDADLQRALRGLLGQYAIIGGNIFIGDNSVGSVGNRLQDGARADAAAARSGPIPGPALLGLRRSYVEPAGYDTLHDSLRANQLVLVRGRSGSGRSATAIHVLDRECAEGVSKLDPDTELKDLRAADFAENTGYLLESVRSDQAAALRAFHLERIVGLLTDRSARLVVIVDQTARLAADGVSAMVVEGLGTPAPDLILRSRLEWELRGSATTAAELLARPDIHEFLAELPADVAPRETVGIARRMVDIAEGRLDVAQLRALFSRASEEEFCSWLDKQMDREQLAFVIALAVFNGESVSLVTGAARLLAGNLQAAEVPRRMDRTRTVFGTRLSERVEAAGAELVDAEEQPWRGGRIPVKQVWFRDERTPRWILEHVCAEHDLAHEIIRDWLLNLGVIPGTKVRVRAGTAAGLLSLSQFGQIYDDVILPWAMSGDPDARIAAMAALQIPARDPRLAAVVGRVLRDWIQRNNPHLRATAALALGTTRVLSPDATLRLLRRAAKDANWVLAGQIAQAIRELFITGDLSGTVLSTLVRWTDDDEVPNRQRVALLAVLVISNFVEADVEGELWPALVWLAERDPDLREHIVVLYARMLNTGDFMRRAYAQVRLWLRVAQREQGMREPLARLLADIAREGDDLDTLDHYLDHWSTLRRAPVDAIKAVWDHLAEQKES